MNDSFVLNSYCTNISFYLVLKAKRIPAHNHPVIERLLTYRNVRAAFLIQLTLSSRNRTYTCMSFRWLLIALLICHSSSMNLARSMLGSRHSIGSFCLVGRKLKRARRQCLLERQRFVIFMHASLRRIVHIKNAFYRPFLLTDVCRACA